MELTAGEQLYSPERAPEFGPFGVRDHASAVPDGSWMLWADRLRPRRRGRSSRDLGARPRCGGEPARLHAVDHRVRLLERWQAASHSWRREPALPSGRRRALDRFRRQAGGRHGGPSDRRLGGEDLERHEAHGDGRLRWAREALGRRGQVTQARPQEAQGLGSLARLLTRRIEARLRRGGWNGRHLEHRRWHRAEDGRRPCGPRDCRGLLSRRRDDRQRWR